MNEIHKLSSPQALEEQLLASEERDVWFFKHSLTCPISTAAWNEFQRFVAGFGEGSAEESAPRFCLVEIQPARSTSAALAERLAMRHESPQAILVRKGKAIWSASHWSITGQALRAAG